MDTRYVTTEEKKAFYRNFLRQAEQAVHIARMNLAMDPTNEGFQLEVTRTEQKLSGFEKLADIDAEGARTAEQRKTHRYITTEELENLCFNALREREQRVFQVRISAVEQGQDPDPAGQEVLDQLARLEAHVDAVAPELRMKKAIKSA